MTLKLSRPQVRPYMSLLLQKHRRRRRGLGAGDSAANYASYPAPAGYRWDFVTENAVRVTENTVPVVELVAA